MGCSGSRAIGIFERMLLEPNANNFLDRARPQSVTNLEFLVLAMRAIGVKHSITNHFTAQLELDMNAAGVSHSMPECPPSVTIYPAKLPVPMRIFDELNTSFATSRPTMTDVLEDLTGSNIAAGFSKEKQPSPSVGGFTILPYVMNGIEQGLPYQRDQKARKGPSNAKTDSSAAWVSEIHGFVTGADAVCPFEQSIPTGDTPSSDSSNSTKMQGDSNTTPPESKARAYPYRHVDPSNHGAKPYGIFQADLTSFDDLPADWDAQNNTINFGNDPQTGNRANNDFTGFDENDRPGAEFHDFIGDGSWGSGS